MAAKHESVFVCTHVSASRRIAVRVLAWDAREALESFTSDLRRAGALGRGRIRIAGPSTSGKPRGGARSRALVTTS